MLGVTPLGFETLSAAAEADPEQKLFTAVDIMVPSLANLHETVGVEALNLGYHVHLEKPISESVESAERLVAAVPEGKVLMIAENSAYWREVVEAKRLIDAGTIGDVLTARCKYWESGHAVLNSWAAAGSYDKGAYVCEGAEGFVFDGGLHWLRPMRMLLGECVEVVATCGATIAHMRGPFL